MGDRDMYQTKAEVLVLIAEGLKDYERNVVEPRHRETQGTLRNIVYLLIAALGGLAANLIIMAVKHQ